MKKVHGFYTVCLSATVCFPAGAQEAGCVFDKHKGGTVSITTSFQSKSDGNGSEKGSGFIVSQDGYILTNAHVVKPRLDGIEITSSKIEVRVGGLSSAPIEATLSTADIDEAMDLALIKIPAKTSAEGWDVLPVSYVNIMPVGSSLMGLGFALAGDIAVVPSGQKTADTTIVDEKPKFWWQTNLALTKGNSGGPIFGKLGTVVGISVAINRNSDLLTYVIPVASAKRLLDKAKVVPSTSGPCADFPLCRHQSHGISGYTVNEIVGDESEWRYGGGNPSANQDSWCADYLASLSQRFPASSFTKISSRDSQAGFDNPTFRQGAKYKYYCEYRRIEGPIYAEKKSAVCLK